MKQLQQIHNIVKSGFRVARIESDRFDTIVDLFCRYSAQTGKPLFLWQQGAGLNRLNGQQMVINNTHLVSEAIDFIEAAPEFGIYILKDFPSKYPVRISYQLQELMSHPNICNCLVILLGAHLPMDSNLGKSMLTIKCASNPQPMSVAMQSSLRQQNEGKRNTRQQNQVMENYDPFQ